MDDKIKKRIYMFYAAGAVNLLLQQSGFEAVSSRPDLAGILRCTGGRWPAGGKGTKRAG